MNKILHNVNISMKKAIERRAPKWPCWITENSSLRSRWSPAFPMKFNNIKRRPTNSSFKYFQEIKIIQFNVQFLNVYEEIWKMVKWEDPA